MEILGLLFAVVFLYGAYHAIRAGVRDGLKDALKGSEVVRLENNATEH